VALTEAVGFAGLGPMGLPMARALLDAGAPVSLWNRTAVKAERLAAGHDLAEVASTPADAARPVVVTMLPDLPQVQQIVDAPDGLRAGWSAAGIDGPVLVVMGTVSPVAVADWAEVLRADGIRLVDAPVSGGVEGAASRRLSIMVGGHADDVGDVRPLLTTMGSTVRHLGPVGAGALAKACNQIVVAGTLNALAEAIALARAGGLDVATVLDLLGGGLAGSTVLEHKRARWVDGDYTGGGNAANQLKDLRFCVEAGRRLGVDLSATDVALDRFLRLVERGEGQLDHSAVLRVVE
jgi:2-hydroxy-3-oxopropionate reductase